MGKIRIKTFEESPEEEAKLKARLAESKRAKKEAKKAEKTRLRAVEQRDGGQAALKNAAKKEFPCGPTAK